MHRSADDRGRSPAGQILIAALICFVALTAAPSRVRADAAANDLIREGVGLRRKGDDEAALQRFEQAYELEHGARALAQIALAEQALGRWAPAHQHLTEALAASADPWIAKNGPTLRSALQQIGEHVGQLEIRGGSPNAEVSIDGVPRGKMPLPAPLVLPTGPITITLGGPGFIPVHRATAIRPHQTTRESFEPLAVVPAAPVERTGQTDLASPPAVVPVASSPPARGARVAVEEEARSPAEVGPSLARASAKWIAWGVAAVGISVGTVAYVQQTDAAKDFNGNCQLDPVLGPQPLPGKILLNGQCATYQSRVDGRYELAIVGFVGAAVAASAGLILWLSEPSRSSTKLAWSCAPGLGGGGLASVGCGRRF